MVFLSEITSETNFPVAVPILQPIMACPVAMVKLWHFEDLPIYGNPSGLTGRKPEAASFPK